MSRIVDVLGLADSVDKRLIPDITNRLVQENIAASGDLPTLVEWEMTLFTAMDDPIVGAGEVGFWSNLINSNQRHFQFEGGHDYLHAVSKNAVILKVCDIILSKMSKS